jgi:hypothetical protein
MNLISHNFHFGTATCRITLAEAKFIADRIHSDTAPYASVKQRPDKVASRKHTASISGHVQNVPPAYRAVHCTLIVPVP